MSGASTMRNAVKRITHKERSQPEARSKLGLLEKHKDYVIRARDYHKKQNYLKVLKKKAAERNPDEFYFKMNKSQVRGGVHTTTKDGSLDTATVKLLKTQDMGYLVHKKSVDDKKVERLKSTLHMIGDQKVKKHTIFVDDEKEIETFDAAKHFNTSEDLVDRAFNRPTVDMIDKQADTPSKLNHKRMAKVMKKKEKAYKELEERTKRSSQLELAVNQLSLQRNLMAKGSKRKVVLVDAEGKRKRLKRGGIFGQEVEEEDVSKRPVVYKWKRERSR